MIDFTKSFDTGLNAAEKAQRNKTEINQVFEHLNIQLAKHTSGKVKISISKHRKMEDVLKFSLFGPKNYYYSITATNPIIGPVSAKELANWEESRAGYPCKINLFSDEIYCEDKLALEQGLSQMLEDPTIGDILYSIINLEPTSVTEEITPEESSGDEEAS